MLIKTNPIVKCHTSSLTECNVSPSTGYPVCNKINGKNDVILSKTVMIAFTCTLYLRLYWKFLLIPITLDWQVKSLSICSRNRDWLTTHRRSAKYPPSLWLSWGQFTWLSISAGIILVQQWVGLNLSQWTAYTYKVRQLMVCVISISTFCRTKASFLSTRSCKVYTWIVLQTLTQIISVQKKLCLIA